MTLKLHGVAVTIFIFVLFCILVILLFFVNNYYFYYYFSLVVITFIIIQNELNNNDLYKCKRFFILFTILMFIIVFHFGLSQTFTSCSQVS